MIDRNRNCIIEVDGETFGFRFSTWALKQAQVRTGCKGVVQLFTRIGVDDANIDLESLSILGVEAHNDYLYSQGKTDSQITQRQMCDIIDKVGGVVDFLQMISEGLATHLPKNQAPPQKAGEKISQ